MKINREELKYISKVKNSLYDRLRIEFLYHSNHIEGSTFSEKGLAALINERIVLGSPTLDDVYETKNSIDLFNEITTNIDNDLDKFEILNWHRILKKGTTDEEIGLSGCWKKYENELNLTDLRLSLPEEVDSKIFNLLLDFNESSKKIDDIAKFHAQFELIHPFQDGNGRIGRFIVFKQCIDHDIDLIAIDKIYHQEYKEALYQAQKYNNYEPLIDVFKNFQTRLDEKLIDYKPVLEQIHNEIASNSTLAYHPNKGQSL